MTTTEYDELIAEYVDGYQIPSYYPESATKASYNKCAAILTALVSDADFVEDQIARGLLKDAMYYDYNHRLNEFSVDYASDLLSWQMGKIGGVE